MTRRKQGPKDLTGVRQRGGRYQIRLFGGQDPVTGELVLPIGSAEDVGAAIKPWGEVRRQVAGWRLPARFIRDFKVVIVQRAAVELRRRRGIGSRSIMAFRPVGGAQYELR
jgi:hypothetical protein